MWVIGVYFLLGSSARTQYFRDPVMAGNDSKRMAGTGTLLFSERLNIKFIY